MNRRFPILYDRTFYLFGMKGVGKRAWLDHELPGAVYVDLNDERLLAKLQRNPQLLKQQLQTVSPGQWVVICELQRLPSLIDEVYPLVANQGLRFALLSSNIHQLKTEYNQKLASGQIPIKRIYPLTPIELGETFDVDEVLRYGTIPSVWNSPDRVSILNHLHSSLQIDLRDTVRSKVSLKQLTGFIKFIPIAVSLHGQSLDVQSVAKQCDIDIEYVYLYMDVLQDIMLATLLPAYRMKYRRDGRLKKPSKRLSSARGYNRETTDKTTKHTGKSSKRQLKLPKLPKSSRLQPKLYWNDCGLLRAFGNNLGPPSEDERASLIEGWILGQLTAYNEQMSIFDQITHWKSARTNSTVTFLLTRDDQRIAIDIKNTADYTKDTLKGLNSVASLAGLTRRILVYTGTKDKSENDIDILTVSSFQEAAKNNSLWI
ncbi:MAG: hypothetical protein OXI96_02920 [Acidimicrobiaceae bacterium]|nr:hypothetical protein [Acidimicrobiaceae bacterium]